MLRRAAGLQISVLVSKTHHGTLIGHIHPLRIRAGRVEGDAEWPLQLTGKNLHLLRLPITGNSAENLDLAGIGLREKKIPIRSSANQAWIPKSGSILLDLESRQNLRPRIRRPWHNARTIARRFGCVRLREILYGDFANVSRLFIPVVDKGPRGPLAGLAFCECMELK